MPTPASRSGRPAAPRGVGDGPNGDALAVLAAVHRVPPQSVRRIRALHSGTFQIFGQLRAEGRVDPEYDLPEPWVAGRWLAWRGYACAYDAGYPGTAEHERVWQMCRERFPRYGIGQPASASPAPITGVPGDKSGAVGNCSRLLGWCALL